MSVLFLDDREERIDARLAQFPDTVAVRTADECIAKLQEQDWDVVYLDHDLGGTTMQDEREPNSGSEVVRWIVKNRPKVKLFVVHSWNAPAGQHMVQALIRAGYSSYYIPFGMGGRNE